MKDILMSVAFAMCLFLTFACAVVTVAFFSAEDPFAVIFSVLAVVFFILTRRLLRAG